MSVFKAIASFLGCILKALWPAIREEARSPGEVRQVGGDPETRDAVHDGIVRDTKG